MSSPGFFQSAAPDVAVAIEAGHVAAARLTWRGSTATIAAHAIETLPPGMVWPSLAASNIADVTAVGRAVAQVVGQLGVKTRRAALVVPDTVAKVSLLKFENVPPKSADLVELMRWQIKKAAPFPLEQATLSFTPGTKPADGGQEFVVSIARTDVLAEYERAPRECHLTAEQLHRALFGESPALFAHVAELDGEVVGCALWFKNFSTWDGVHGVYLVFRPRRGSLGDVAALGFRTTAG